MGIHVYSTLVLRKQKKRKVHDVHVLRRDEKEGRKVKQTRQSMYMYIHVHVHVHRNL